MPARPNDSTPAQNRGTARKGQGQWALGYREPLNPNERAKRDNDGLLVKQRIIDIYQHTGFAGIDPAICATGSAGTASTRSGAPGSPAARRPRWNRRSSRTSSS